MKRRRVIHGAVLSVLTLAVLVYIASALITGGWPPDMAWLLRAVSGNTSAGDASEFYYETGKNRVFADLGDGFASAGTLGIQVFDKSGAETVRDVFRMESPAIRSSSGKAIAFDIGGTQLRVFDSSKILSNIETQSAVVSGSINKNGWFCVVTQASGAYKGAVTVYNAKGNSVYKISTSGYALAATLSADNKSAAVLTLTADGSKITFYTLSSETPGASFTLDGGLIIDIMYLADGRVIAVSEGALLLVGKKGDGETLLDYGGSQLGGYAEDGGLIVLSLPDFSVGSHGRLVALRVKDGVTGERSIESECLAISVNNGQIAVLWDDGLALYGAELSEESPPRRIAASGARYALPFKDGVFLGGEYSAIIITAGLEVDGA